MQYPQGNLVETRVSALGSHRTGGQVETVVVVVVANVVVGFVVVVVEVVLDDVAAVWVVVRVVIVVFLVVEAVVDMVGVIEEEGSVGGPVTIVLMAFMTIFPRQHSAIQHVCMSVENREMSTR